MTDAQRPEGRNGRPTDAPTAPQGGPFPVPLVSVILPYQDPRRRPQHLATWTRGQTLPAAQFELGVVARPGEPHRDALRAYLRPHDRLLFAEADGPFPMYAAGAEAARGELLFFTEDHCLADPDCLRAAVAVVGGGEVEA